MMQLLWSAMACQNSHQQIFYCSSGRSAAKTLNVILLNLLVLFLSCNPQILLIF